MFNPSADASTAPVWALSLGACVLSEAARQNVTNSITSPSRNCNSQAKSCLPSAGNLDAHIALTAENSPHARLPSVSAASWRSKVPLVSAFMHNGLSINCSHVLIECLQRQAMREHNQGEGRAL